jgi:hypothetical protein
LGSSHTFMEVKRLFSTMPQAKKWRRKEVTEVIGRVTGRATGRWIGRGWRVRSVQPAGARGEVRGFVTGASDHSRDRRVRLRTQESSTKGRFDRMWWRVRVWLTKSLSGPLLDSNQTSGVTRPVNSSIASGHALSKKVTFRDHWRSNE